MGFLKKLVGALTGGGGAAQDDSGVYVYVKVKRSGEIVRLRLMPGYDISKNEDGRFFSRKMVMGGRSFERVDATFYFDKSYKLVEADTPGGEIVDEEAYQEQEDRLGPPEAAQ